MAMRVLTAAGQDRLAEIASRQGVSTDAAQSMLTALLNGGGTMAQFSHPEFGGSGQWMQGGMTMVSDLFNNALKATVDNLCNDLAGLVLNPQQGLWQDAAPTPATPSWQHQQQGQGASLSSGMSMGFGGGNWWPADLGVPNSSGSQNDLRYAYFGGTSRLAVEVAGSLTVYDTGNHQISGVSQQQGNGWTLTFTSQYGTVPVSSLRVVDGNSSQPDPLPAPAPTFTSAPPPATPIPTPAPASVESQPAPAPGGLEDSVWSFGPADGAPTGTLTLAADGVIAGGNEAQARFWSVEDGGLTFYDADGRTALLFPAVAGDGVLRGHAPADPAQVYVLRAPATRRPDPAAPPPAAAAALPVDVTAGDWVLEDAGGNRLSVLRLQPDGRVEGGRETEASWRTKDDGIVLLHRSGRPTARFELFQYRAGRWTVVGAPLNNPSAPLFLKQA
ncbi:hypothetical protein ABNQ38_31835 [Azospirillum sp. A29]|uniref:hypothetical protein n=1 Tax=Azospirillum sp. A29 TaxID=3160606 RepID=UPI00366F3B4A